MSKRIKEITSNITPCTLFADIGCDHGYVSENVLKTGKAKKVIISDISEKSLSKAVKLLQGYGDKVQAIVSNGFEKLPSDIDECLIAGMGGEEIIKILENAKNFPDRLVLQPMKNTDKVRIFLLNNGYKSLRDYTFKDDKFYDLLVFEKGIDEYSPNEIKFGRDNLKNPQKDFIEYLEFNTDKIKNLFIGRELTLEVKNELNERLNELESIYETVRNISNT